MEKTRVFVLAEVQGNDIIFRFFTENTCCSVEQRLPGQKWDIGGNPYSIYGHAIAKILGKDWKNLSLTVFKAVSGNLSDGF